MKTDRRALLALAALVSMVPLACGDDDAPNEPVAPDLSGTYALVSVTQAGITLGPAQGATGTLTLTKTTYVIDLTIPDQTGAPVNTVDNGTYSINGNTWTQESSATGFQGVGTYTFQNGTLTVNVTTAGLEVLTVWSATG